MQYSRAYIDTLFDSIEDYETKVELLNIAYPKQKDKPYDWFVEMSEIMNWQAMSDRSGVWTYYESLEDISAQKLLRLYKEENQNEIINKYLTGIGRHKDEKLMDEIDVWIKSNEIRIYNYIEKIVVMNRDWFYQI